MYGSSSVKFCTFNVKGIHHPIKRKKILSTLKKEKVHVAFLQETHLVDKEHIKLKRDWVGQIYYSSFSSNSRGVAILIHRSVPFVLGTCRKDPEGRYVLLQGTIYGTQITMMNIYAPTPPLSSFWTRVGSELVEYKCGLTLLGGDCNCALDINLDKSHRPSNIQSNNGAMLASMLDDVNLVDAWRTLNPLAKDFTFYSNPHNSFSRIDYFFLAPEYVGQVNECNIGSIYISDHAPVYLDVNISEDTSKTMGWRFPSYILSDKDFKNKMEEELNLYFDKNDTSDTNPEFLWEAAKAYIRGFTLSYMSHKKKKLLMKQDELEKDLKKAESAHKSNPTKENLIKAQALRAALNSILNEKASKSLFYQKQRLYEYGNKPSKYLARLLNQRETNNSIGAIRDPKGIRHYDRNKISSVFVSFYKSLYKSENISTKEDLDKFFSQMKLPTLTDEQQEILGRPIEKEEIFKAISLMHSGKSPGPDGFPVEWFKSFKEKIVPYLLKTYNYSFSTAHHLPETMTQANICLILKKNKDSEDPASYRPVSLINVDAKILAKILSLRLESVMTLLVKPDQSGFIKGRNSFHNIRRLLNILQQANIKNIKGLVVSLDSLKAFDRVEWLYLFFTMDKFQLGNNFIDWVKLLYCSPKAAVITNSHCSDIFHLERGTRQGCPLSPLLFALAIEPFAELIRTSPHITGFVSDGVEHKISLYADDVLLYLTEIDTSISHLLDYLKKFGHISGFKVNLSKTEAMPIGAGTRLAAPTGFPFHWSPKEITYLGIRVSPSLKKLFKLNMTPIVTRIREDLDRWKSLPVSWLGRLSVLKMNILPRLMYPLQMLPNSIPNCWFKKLDKMFTHYIWQGKKVRMKISKLQRSKDQGGIAVPNVRLYYWAAQMRYIYEWVNPDVSNTWIDMESRNCGLVTLKHSPFINYKGVKLEVQNNFIVQNTINTWYKILLFFRINNHFSLLAPIFKNPDFIPSCQDSVFKVWHEKGLDQLAKLFEGDTMVSFENLKKKYALQQSHFFRYLQIRHFVPKTIHPPNMTFVEQILTQPKPKRFISNVYKSFTSNLTSSTDHIRRQWQIDFGEEIDDNKWTQLVENTLKILNCNSDRERQFKILHRLHFTPSLRGKLGLGSTFCSKCNCEIGTYVHMFWKCDKVQKYWSDVKNEVSALLGYNLDLSPFQCVLAAKVVSTRDKHGAKLIEILLYIARKTILKLWISKDCPTIEDWYTELLRILPLERLTYTLHDNIDTFLAIWQPVLDKMDLL